MRRGAGGGFLPNCDWSEPLVLSVSADGVASGQEIRLTRGAVLRIRVNDPLGLLPAVETPLAPPHLTVGARNELGAIYLASGVGRDASGRNYALTIPYDRFLKLWVFSRHVRVADATGAPLDNRGGADLPLRVARGAQFQDLVINIVAAEPPEPVVFVPPIPFPTRPAPVVRPPLPAEGGPVFRPPPPPPRP